jgi:hypothetical protein
MKESFLRIVCNVRFLLPVLIGEYPTYTQSFPHLVEFCSMFTFHNNYNHFIVTAGVHQRFGSMPSSCEVNISP